MAVKVVSKKPVHTKKKVCPYCGFLLEYTENDVHEYSGRDMSGGPDGQTWIICPKDGKQVILTSW